MDYINICILLNSNLLSLPILSKYIIMDSWNVENFPYLQSLHSSDLLTWCMLSVSFQVLLLVILSRASTWVFDSKTQINLLTCKWKNILTHPTTLPPKNLKTVVTLVHSESTGPCQLIELHTSIYNPWCFATLATSYIYVGEERNEEALLPGECANIAVATSCKTHHTHSQKCGLLLMQAGGGAAAARRRRPTAQQAGGAIGTPCQDPA